ncbi:MAG TPA: glycoside hydrolase family 18 protein [Anaerolineales bacterium]
MEGIRVLTSGNKPFRRLRPNPGTGIGCALRIAFSAAAIALAGTGCGNLTLETTPDNASTITATDNFTSGPTPARSEVPMNSSYHLVGYYASWDVYERAVFLTRIQTDRITHINYAFSNISPEGKCVLGDVDADTQRFFGIGNSIDGTPDTIDGARGNFHQLAILKQKNPNLKVLISVGGWTWSEHFSDAALSEESRLEFVKSCLDLYLVRYGDAFDGVDIDWEYPVSGGLKPGRPEDKHNFTLLLEEFRHQIDVLQQTTGRKYLLTIAGPASPESMGRIELSEIHKVLDWINVMAYDFHVAAEPSTGFLSPLYGSPRDPDQNSKNFLNDNAAVRGYLATGVPAKKIVLGIPFYGRAWQGATGDGLFAPAAGPARAKYEFGYMDYVEILNGPLQKYQRHWDDDAKVPWLFDPASGTFITYDDAESIQWKVKYIQENGLGGGMIWELGSDGGKLLAPLADSLFR